MYLQVNGIDMTGKTQGDAVSILRNTNFGSTVSLVVSRQEVEEEDERFKVPRQLVSGYGRAPDKSVYWKTIFFISHPKHMLWVLKRIISMRRFF